MVLKKYLRILSGALTFIIMVLLFSCEDIIIYVDCTKCKPDEQKDAEIEIKVSSNFSVVEINIFEGNIEDSILYKSVFTYGSSTTVTLPLNRSYTFSAKYLTSVGDIYHVVNSITPRVKYVEDQCDEPCYFVYDNKINLKLKYNI
jgi:hypothetical protein